MRKRLIYGCGVLLLAVLFTLVVWQGSFSFGDYGPSSPQQTYVLWAISTLIFLLTVTLGFMLARNFVKLYVERRSNREGSRIRSKLVLGALALSCVPVFFLVLFSIYVLNRNLEKWFTRPAENIKIEFVKISRAIDREHQDKARTQARWIASLPSVRQLAGTAGFGAAERAPFESLCREHRIEELLLRTPGGTTMLCESAREEEAGKLIAVEHPLEGGEVILKSRMSLDVSRTQDEIDREIRKYDQLAVDKKTTRANYLQLLVLITLFILFFAVWVALFLAKQISGPISALLGAAEQVRRGNLAHRVDTAAMDELATLVRSFNQMTADLETNSRELENRRRFMEAILESIPTGVISLASDGRILRVNRALKGFFSAAKVEAASRLEDLFTRDDIRELRYLMNRARRMGVAASQFELRTERKSMPISLTVAALDDKVTFGFVVVLEDMSDLLHAQKAAAWNEVARRIAHEIKNPLTPISLSAERIARQLDRRGESRETDRILRECSAIIAGEVQSLKSLVDAFSQFARFPAARPAPSDLNEVVESALGIFGGRLQAIEVHKHLAPGLPQVNIDREQFKRLVVNLVDNAAEAMQESPLKRLEIATSAPTPESVELVIADTGCGISAEDKEKLFLPYFSTKGRGTGLGLAIVNHILSDHGATIRVEDNQPQGARFLIELNAPAPAEADARVAEARA